jgi:hypothetical protein
MEVQPKQKKKLQQFNYALIFMLGLVSIELYNDKRLYQNS